MASQSSQSSMSMVSPLPVPMHEIGLHGAYAVGMPPNEIHPEAMVKQMHETRAAGTPMVM